MNNLTLDQAVEIAINNQELSFTTSEEFLQEQFEAATGFDRLDAQEV